MRPEGLQGPWEIWNSIIERRKRATSLSNVAAAERSTLRGPVGKVERQGACVACRLDVGQLASNGLVQGTSGASRYSWRLRIVVKGRSKLLERV